MSFLAAAGGSAFNSGLDFLGSMWQNTQSKKAATTAFAREVALWDLQNEYNLPKNQMARLRDAGLNPQLALGNGTISNTSGGFSSVPTSRGSDKPRGNPVEDYYNIATKKNLLEQSKAQTRVLNAEADNKEKTSEGISYANSVAKYEALMKSLEYDVTVQNKGYNPNSPLGALQGSSRSVGGFLKDWLNSLDDIRYSRKKDLDTRNLQRKIDMVNAYNKLSGKGKKPRSISTWLEEKFNNKKR